MIRATVAAGGRHVFVRFFAALIGLTAATIYVVLSAAPAAAQIYYPGAYNDSPRYKMRKKRPAARPQVSRAVPGEPDAAGKTKGAKQDAKTAEKTAPKGPLFAVVSLGDQKITVYNHDGIVAQSRVSTGTASHPTPKGVFTILGRSRYHFSNIYSGAPMPFMQRVTWSGVALHQGVVPGYPASHGCIRLPGGFAAHLWGLTKVNERVVIARSDVRPVPISHPALPVPKMQPAESDVVTASTGKSAAVHHLAQIGTAEAAAAPAAEPSTPPAGTALLNPLQYVEQLKAKASAEATATAKAAQDALAIAGSKKGAATKAAAALRAAEMAYEAADKKALAAAEAVLKAAPEKKEAAEIASLNAQSMLSSTRSKIESLRADADAKDAEWTEKVDNWREASAAAEAARSASRALSRRASPVSVLVSKKDQMVYVRQGLAPLLDAPATVRDPETPLGTHLYIATAAGDDNATLKWTVLSMPSAAAEPERQPKNKKQARAEPPPVSNLRASSAEEALERIDIPADVRERISELLWTGGSMIISDQPLSSETSDIGTDLVVKVR